MFEFNARNQITLWGPSGQIMDYAAKQWSGLVKDYYSPRWDMFFGVLQKKLKTGQKFDEAEFRKEFIDKIGRPFTKDKRDYPVKAIGDTIQVAKKLYKKWRPFV